MIAADVALKTQVAICFLAVVSSCGSAKRDLSAVVTVPKAFSQSGPAALPDSWWVSFGDPALAQLVERALRDSLTIKSAWDRLDQATALARRAGAGHWPSLDGEAGAGYSFSNTGNHGDLSLGLAAQYELDLWGRIRSEKDAARLEMLASETDLRAMAISISAEVAATWYRIAEKQRQLDLLKQQDITNRQMLDLLNVRFRSGQAYAADLLQQQQLIESNNGEQARIISQIEVLEHQLAVLVGLTPDQRASGEVASLVTLPPLPSSGLPAELLQRRPDVQSSYYRVHAADKRIAAAIAERFPRISLSARATTSGTEVRDLFSNWLVNLSANLLAPLFDGQRRKADVDLARATASLAFHDYGQVVLEALREVEDALVLESHQRIFLKSLEKQLELSTQVNERIRDNYTKGAEVFMRVLDSLLRHQALERAYVTAEYELIVNRISLCRALAGSWQLMRPNNNRQAGSDNATTGGA